MDNKMENGLVVNQPNQLQADIFGGEQRVKKATSLDLNNEEDADMLLNAMQDVENKLNDFVGQTLEIRDYFAQEFESDTFNEETGEQVTRKKHTLTLFATDGKTYVTGSNACYRSFVDIISIKGQPSKERPLKLIPVKVDAKEKGHSYLKLKLGK